MRLKRVLLPTLLAAGLLLAAGALAAGNFGLESAGSAAGISKNTDLAATIGNLIKFALSFVGTLFLVLMIYAGFTYMTARGDSKKIDQAKQMITGAIIGVLIVAGAYAMTSFILGAVSGAGGQSSNVEKFSVPIGGDCSQSGDCAGTGVCDSGKCVEANFGSCVPNKSCSADSDCSSNGACADGACLCDAL